MRVFNWKSQLKLYKTDVGHLKFIHLRMKYYGCVCQKRRKAKNINKTTSTIQKIFIGSCITEKAKPLLAEYKEKQIQKVSVLKEIVLNIMYV